MNEKHIYILEKVRKLNGKMSMIYVDFGLGEENRKNSRYLN